jgi:hypothetical protein
MEGSTAERALAMSGQESAFVQGPTRCEEGEKATGGSTIRITRGMLLIMALMGGGR